MRDPDVVVVGSGPNGLAAAVRMAQAGRRVVVHEAEETFGGGARTLPLTLPGFQHDICSAVHPMGAGSPFFRRLDLERHGLEWIHPPVMVAHPFDDGTAAALYHSTADTGATLGPDSRAYQKLMDPFVDRWEALFDEALGPLVHLPKRPLLLARLGLLGLRSAMGLAQSRFQGERAQALFVGLAGHTLLPMDRSPSAAFGIMLAVGGHGPGWPIPRGGSQRIADALLAVLREQGGEVVTGSRVDDVDALGRPETILLDLTPRQVLRVAGHRLPRRYRRQLQAFRYAPGVFKMDWALSEPIPWASEECRRAGTVHLGGSAEAIAASAEASWYGRPDPEPYIILAQPSLFDDSRAPDGQHTAWAYCHVPNGSLEDRTEAMEQQIERFAPGFRDTILARNAMNTRQMESHNANLVGGDINGGLQNVRQLLFRPAIRLNPYSTPADGLFICSASTPPGGGVHGMCGLLAAETALKG